MFNNFFTYNCAVYEIMWKIKNTVEPDRPQMTMVHARLLRLQANTQNMSYLLLFHSNNGYTNMLRCYVIRTLPVLYVFVNSLMMAVMIN